MSWNDLATADADFVTEVWADAADIEPLTLQMLFDVANIVCAEYAPALSLDAVIPATYKLAEIMQARHCYSQMQGGNKDSFGDDGLNVPLYPLVFAARDLLRPKSSPLVRVR